MFCFHFFFKVCCVNTADNPALKFFSKSCDCFIEQPANIKDGSNGGVHLDFIKCVMHQKHEAVS